MNTLSIGRRTQIINCLCEGMSVRATSRITSADKKTILRLLADVGTACREYMDRAFVDLPCKRVQCDEIWSFCYAKDKNLPASMKGKPGVGSIWTWTALCADTKLVPSFHVGTLDAAIAASPYDAAFGTLVRDNEVVVAFAADRHGERRIIRLCSAVEMAAMGVADTEPLFVPMDPSESVFVVWEPELNGKSLIHDA